MYVKENLTPSFFLLTMILVQSSLHRNIRKKTCHACEAPTWPQIAMSPFPIRWRHGHALDTCRHLLLVPPFMSICYWFEFVAPAICSVYDFCSIYGCWLWLAVWCVCDCWPLTYCFGSNWVHCNFVRFAPLKLFLYFPIFIIFSSSFVDS